MDYLIRAYRATFDRFSMLQSPFLLVIRFYWGWQFAETGWAKLHHLAKITAFFTSLNIPLPAFNAYFVSGLELIGGVLLILGMGSRLTSFLLAGDMLVAYWTADRDALAAVLSSPGKFYAADPYTFLFASLVVLIFGAGLLSIDALILNYLNKRV